MSDATRGRSTRRLILMPRGMGGGRASRIWDAILALCLASLFAYYIDFKLRKPGELRAFLPQTIEELPQELPAGVDNVVVELVDPPAVIFFAVDGPKEVVDRLRDRTIAYDIRLTRADIAAALSGNGKLEHRIELGNVSPLPDRVHQRRDDEFPKPKSVMINVLPYCEAMLPKVEFTNEFRVVPGLEIGESRLPTVAVRVKIFDLPQPPARDRCTLLLDASSIGEQVQPAELSIPLTRFDVRVMVGEDSYRAEVLDPLANVEVSVIESRVPVEVRVAFDPNFPDGLTADDVPAHLDVFFKVPAARASEYQKLLEGAAGEGRPFSMRATIVWPLQPIKEFGLMNLRHDPEPGSAIDLKVVLVEAPPQGVEFVGFRPVGGLSLKETR